MIDNNKSEEIASIVKNDDNKAAEHKRKRDIIKNVLIVFLAVMLVLTFFSNTIMNRSLAEISTESTSSGKLTERLRGSGFVESNQVYDVMIDGNKVIDTICVKTGQEVEKDTVLFIVGTGESAELVEAQTALETLQLDYQKALLVPPVDYSAENQAIKYAREDLNSAIAKRDEAIANQGTIQAELEQYNNNKVTLEQKLAVKDKLTATLAAIDMDDYSSAAVDLIGNLASRYNNYASAESDYNTALSIYNNAVLEGGDVTAAKETLNSKETARNAAKANYDAEKASIRDGLVPQLNTVESEINGLNAAIAAYELKNQSGVVQTVEELNADVQAKQRALEDVIIALNKTQTENNMNNQITTLDIEAKKAEIEKQQKKVDELKKKNETTEIKSKYSGIVSSINVKPGEDTVPDTPIATIDIASEGYTVKITVDGEKAKKVKVGAEAEVLNNWGGEIKAVLSEIKNDTTSGSKNRILVFSLTGDVDSSTNIDLSIPCGSGNYDVIVPKSAIYEDKNGKFVLTVKSKSSPLGNRYYAERVAVEVLASDETSTAVSGDISFGDYVITAASKPVSPKDQVRMKD